MIEVLQWPPEFLPRMQATHTLAPRSPDDEEDEEEEDDDRDQKEEEDDDDEND
jgi:hypothetical protein